MDNTRMARLCMKYNCKLFRGKTVKKVVENLKMR